MSTNEFTFVASECIKSYHARASMANDVAMIGSFSRVTCTGFAQEPSSDSAPPPPPGRGAMRYPGFGPGPFRDRMELLGIGGMHGKVVTGAPFAGASMTPE